MSKLDEIFARLGLDRTNGLFITKENLWKDDIYFPNRVKRLIERKIEPTAFFCFDNKPMILFFDSPEDKAALHERIWNFNECPITIIVENDLVEIFNGFHYLKDKKSLEKLGGNDKLNDFSYFELVTGRTWEQYKEYLDYKNRVDYHLLQNIKAARQILVGDNEKRAKLANALLGKVIFVRYLIDRKVKMKFDDKLRTWTNQEFCELLDNPQQAQQFFDYLEDKEKGFNGDLFPLSSSEYKQVRKSDYQVLKRLLLGGEITTNQRSLFELYDFSIIPIEFISNVYELFIGQDNQKKEGAYYTPLFLVDYILKETVEVYLHDSSKTNVRINELSSKQPSVYSYCKVLDPACGSGIFLVETLRKIIEKYIVDTGIEIKSDRFKTAIKNLAKENIYGIDKDLSAVQVAIFSIYLTLLDYLEPPGIETFKFPILSNTNFFEADFFDEAAEFNTQLKDIEFNYILGNPPWMRGKGEKNKPLYVEYIEKRRKKEKATNQYEIEIGNKEIAQAFLLRSSDFSKAPTKCSLIVTSKVLYNLQSKCFREYFLHNFFIDRVFELAPVRREIFDKSNDKAIAPACVLFFRFASGVSTDQNIIEHFALKPSRFFSLFKIFTISRTDFKEVQQNRLKEFDWLWKILVYGSYLDFNFISRLKEHYQTIGDLINDKEKFIIKQGIKKKDGDKKLDVSELVGWNYIDTDVKSKNLQPYFISPILEKWKQKEVGYIYRDKNKKIVKAIFSPPAILIKDGLTPEFETVAALLDRKGVFTDNITSVKPITSDAEKYLENILVLLNSKFNSYWAFQTASFVGIKQERSHDEEKFSLPFVPINNAKTISDKITALKNDYHHAQTNKIFSNKPELIEKKIAVLLKNIDDLILKKIDLSQQEGALIDYACNYLMPLIKGKQKNLDLLKYEDSFLKNYAQLFLDRFQSNLSNKERRFVVEIWHTNQVIGMLFKVIPMKEYKSDIVWVNKQDDASGMLPFLIKVSSSKLTDRLFVQKDVRGFVNDKGYFYIFKPNEKRIWHKAIGYLDVQEFSDAILKEGRSAK